MDIYFEDFESLIDSSVETYCLVSIENTRIEIAKLKELLDNSDDKETLVSIITEKEEHIDMCRKELDFIRTKVNRLHHL